MMARWVGFGLAVLLCTSVSLAEAPPPPRGDTPEAHGAPAADKRVRRVQRLERMKITGRPARPQAVAVIERERVRFETGTIRFSAQRRSYERYE